MITLRAGSCPFETIDCLPRGFEQVRVSAGVKHWLLPARGNAETVEANAEEKCRTKVTLNPAGQEVLRGWGIGRLEEHVNKITSC